MHNPDWQSLTPARLGYDRPRDLPRIITVQPHSHAADEPRAQFLTSAHLALWTATDNTARLRHRRDALVALARKGHWAYSYPSACAVDVAWRAEAAILAAVGPAAPPTEAPASPVEMAAALDDLGALAAGLEADLRTIPLADDAAARFGAVATDVARLTDALLAFRRSLVCPGVRHG